MSPIILSITIIAYFMILFAISYIAGHKADNEGFFVGNRKSAWYIVAFAMIGSTISGVTFVSVPGMVQASPTCKWYWDLSSDSSLSHSYSFRFSTG